jgi:predicted transcriptional regulator
MEIIKSVWDALGISQKELARILGISLSIFKQVETCRRDLPLDAWNVMFSIYSFVGTIDRQKKADVPL